MTTETLLEGLAGRVADGTLFPYLGAGALAGACNVQTGEPIPADSDSLILAMNDGRPMAPKLMYEFPRAAMNLELKRGRSYVNNFLTRLYGETEWTRAPLHDWLATVKPPYVIDINRDTQLQASYADTPHHLITGIARIGGTDFRYRLYRWDGQTYQEISNDEADPALPILYKPMGTPLPEPSYIASDADYVDFITELMGGFSVPGFVKARRKGAQYLFIGLRMTRDTERMVLSDLIFDAGEPAAWALIKEPTDKERRFCQRQRIEIVEADVTDLLAVATAAA